MRVSENFVPLCVCGNECIAGGYGFCEDCRDAEDDAQGRDEGLIVEHLEASCLAAQRRFGDSYARDYVIGMVDEFLPRTVSKRPTKKKINPALRWEVFKRDDFRCRQCGARDRLCADHIYPESRGGETTFENLQTLCAPCNSSKGARV